MPKPRAPKVVDLGARGIEALGLSPRVQGLLASIQNEVSEAYRESFVHMLQALNKQASALDRIQATLEVLVQQLPAAARGNLPPAIRVAEDGEAPDLATAVLIADPIATGYTLSLTTLAQAMNLSVADVSILAKAFKLSEDASCAVVVRRGTGRSSKVVNYHPRAIQTFRQRVASPPSDLGRDEKSALARVRKKLIVAPETTVEPAELAPTSTEDE